MVSDQNHMIFDRIDMIFDRGSYQKSYRNHMKTR